MLNFLIEHWYFGILIFAIGIVVGYYIEKFIKQPTSAKIEIIKKLLVGACLKAEKRLGSGTGRLKLLEVYEWFVEKFPSIAQTISFETFSDWVDDALVEAEHILKTNPMINNYING